MEFTLALTHFCEVHGPKSVLCTQILPLECAVCVPSPRLRPQASSDTLATKIYEPNGDDDNDYMSESLHSTRTTGTTSTLPTDFSGASTNVDSEPVSPTVGHPRLHKAEDQSKGIDPQFKYGRAQGDTCASCGFTVPQSVANMLPRGAPGSAHNDDKARNTAPVLRSRETVCLGPIEGIRKRRQPSGQSSSQESNSSSIRSSGSRHSHVDCHDHTLTYLTTKSPDDPENYAHLRAAVIRTLSCEQLPKGMSDGRLYFGDDETGHTIAYVFRLTDPKARGRRRAYAFVALAGKNGSRAIKACPMLWDAFATMANRIEQSAQRYQEEQRRMEEEDDMKRQYTPIASYLTQRSVDPDGHLRRTGQTTPRSLADIIGDENIFAILHGYFAAVLQCLGNQFGGLPMTAEASAFQSLVEKDEEDHNSGVGRHTTLSKRESMSRHDRSSKVQRSADFEIEQTKQQINRKIRQNSQYAPLTIDAIAEGRVVS